MSVIANFLQWKETARVPERIAAAAALARTYVQRELNDEQKAAAHAAMTILLDDPSPKVRMALSDGLCMSGKAPVDIVVALAADQREVAAPVILHSPLLTDSDLVGLLTQSGRAEIQVLIASRMDLSPRVIATIAEIGSMKACAVLASRKDVHIPDISMRRIIECHGRDGTMRSLLLKNGSLSPCCRHLLLKLASEALGASPLVVGVLGEDGARAAVANARTEASVTLVENLRQSEQTALAARMRENGELTSSLLVRMVAFGRTGFFVAAMSAVTGIPEVRLAGLFQAGSRRALLGLLRQAGLRPVTHEPILAALLLCREVDAGRKVAGPLEISRVMLNALEESVEGGEQERAALASLLRRIHLEEMRKYARNQAWALAAA